MIANGATTTPSPAPRRTTNAEPLAGCGSLGVDHRVVATLGSVTLHADRTGRGPVVLWTHGFGSSSHLFDATREGLDHERTIITWDLPGHGRSVVPERPEEFTPERALDHMTALLDEAGVERAVLGGHSLGGYLSLRYALDHPDRVAALVLVGTGPGYRKPEGREQWNAMCEGFARDLDAKGLDGLGGSPELRNGIHRGGAGGLAMAARNTLPQRDSRVIDELATITAPALIVVGERDRQFLASSQFLADRLPAADELVVIADCGHAPPISRPDEFVAAVRAFLDRHHP